jgi:hypothetical protein
VSEFPDIDAVRAQRIVEIYIEHMQEALQARKQKLKTADRPRPRVSIAITIVYCATAAGVAAACRGKADWKRV